MNGSTVEIGRYPSNVTNDDLKWESQKQYNIGFDFGVLDNRFSITADFYYKRIDDMLLQVNIPSIFRLYQSLEKCRFNGEQGYGVRH